MSERFEKSYADFGLGRSLRQVRHAAGSRKRAGLDMQALLQSMELPVSRIVHHLGGPLEGRRILEIGPGQGLERARFFATDNDVVAIDRDLVAPGLDPTAYLGMVRTNGVGRAAKTLGRYLLVGRANEKAWKSLLGGELPSPTVRTADIEREPVEPGEFDVVTSWSVFEHLPDPRRAFENVLASLRPGGVFHISIHLYTAPDGHHDIRSFTGHGDELPLWGHLRPAKAHEINPSAFLNEWRIPRWRSMFSDLAPEADEFLDSYELLERYGPQMTPELRAELSDYTDEELYTVNAVYVGRKPVS